MDIAIHVLMILFIFIALYLNYGAWYKNFAEKYYEMLKRYYPFLLFMIPKSVRVFVIIYKGALFFILLLTIAIYLEILLRRAN